MKNILLLFVLSFIFEYNVKAQIPNPVSFPDGVSVGAATTNGLFTPPLKTTAQINAITGMQIGMIVYDTDEKCLKIYNGSNWNCLTNNVSGSSAFSENGPTQNFAKRVSVGTSSISASFNDMEIANDSLYVIGNFMSNVYGASGQVDMDGFIYNYTFNTNENHHFISKYSPQANRVWTFQFPSPYINVVDIKWHNSFLYMTGSFSTPVTLTVNGTPTTYTPSNGTDTFVAKMDGNGNFVWFTKSTQSTGYDAGYCLTISKGTTDLYLAGAFENTLTLGGGTPLTSIGGSTDIFICLLDTQTGAYKTIGSNYVNTRGGGSGTDVPASLISTVVLSGQFSSPLVDLICVGSYINGITFGTSTVTSGINNNSIFIAHFPQSMLSSSPNMISINGVSSGQTVSCSSNTVDNNFYYGNNQTTTTLQLGIGYGITTGSLNILGKTISGIGTLLVTYDIGLYSGLLTLKKASDFKNLSVSSMKNGILAGHLRSGDNLLLDNQLLSNAQQRTIVMSINGKGDLEWIRNGGVNTTNFIYTPGAFASFRPLAVKNHSGKVWVYEKYKGNHSFGDWIHNGTGWTGSLWALY